MSFGIHTIFELQVPEMAVIKLLPLSIGLQRRHCRESLHSVPFISLFFHKYLILSGLTYILANV